MKLIRNFIFRWRYKRAVKDADRKHAHDGRKYFVFVWNGKPIVLSKKETRVLHSKNCFKRGLTVQDIYAKAVYVTR